MKYFVARLKCKGNPFFHLHGNTEHFHIVNSQVYANNNKKRNVLCLSMATGYENAPQNNTVRTFSILLCRNDVTVQNLGVTIMYYSLTFTIKLYVTVSLT